MNNIYAYKRNIFGTVLNVTLKVDYENLKDENVIITFPLKYKLHVKYISENNGKEKVISYSRVRVIKNKERYDVALTNLKCMLNDMRNMSKGTACQRILVTVNEENRTYKQYRNIYYNSKMFTVEKEFMLNVEEVITILNGLIASIYNVGSRLAA